MRRAIFFIFDSLTKFFKWIEARFPEKIQVNQAEYEALATNLANLRTAYINQQADIDALKAAIKGLREAVGMSGTMVKSEIEKAYEKFVNGV